MTMTGGGLLTNGRTQQQAPQMQAPPAAQPAPPQTGGVPQGGPTQPQVGGGQGGMPAQGTNDVASNALMVLHGPKTGERYQQMIKGGPSAAAKAVAQIYDVVVNEYNKRGAPIDESMASEAADAVITDVSQMGLAMGSFPPEPVSNNGTPTSVHDFARDAMNILAAKHPEMQQAIASIASEPADPEDEQAGQEYADYYKQTNPEGMNPQGMPPQGMAQ